MPNILVYCEHQDGAPKKAALEIVGKAAELAAGGDVIAAVLGSGLAGDFEALAHHGATRILKADDAALGHYQPEAFAAVFGAMIAELSPRIVLATSSPDGKDLMARVAARAKGGLATDCIELRAVGDGAQATRPIFAGKALVDVDINSAIQFFTLRPNSFGLGDADSGKSAAAEAFTADVGDVRSKVVDVAAAASDKPDLTEADRIVSGGRAMGNAENFAVLDELADVLGATVGASRAAVDAGYAHHPMQVGQTGKTVNPVMYIACGISGAIQHLAGMRTSKVIVAINKDAEAPIFSKASYGIVGDLFEVVPELSKQLKAALE
jgi:electron transfer flavoprotein alpha subunit